MSRFVRVNLAGAFAVAEVAMERWRDVAQLAATNVMLSFVQFGSSVRHPIGEVIPTLLRWFARNWRDIFTDLFNIAAGRSPS